ncbi:MAG: ROK family protein [Herpetosiphon sp.]
MHESLQQIERWFARESRTLVGSQGTIAGIDIGSYGLRAVLTDLQHGTMYSQIGPSPDGDPDATIKAACDLVRALLKESGREARHLARIGIGFGGPVDAERGITRVSYRRPGWEEVALAARMEEAFNAPVLVDNDANVIALAESTWGAGIDSQNLFYLHLSSGVGGGLVIDGRLYHGASSSAGEIGHAIVQPDGPPCSCGSHGHVESYLSLGALLRRMGELGVQSDDLDVLWQDTSAAKQTVTEACVLLGRVIANVVVLTDPGLVVVGGIVARSGGEAFLEPLRHEVHRCLTPAFHHPIPVVPSTFGYDSVAAGGLALALASLQE